MELETIEGQARSLPQSNDNERDNRWLQNESSSFLEYHVPLQDADDSGPDNGRRSRSRYHSDKGSSKGGDSRDLDHNSAVIGESDEHAVENAGDHDKIYENFDDDISPEHVPKERPQRRSQHQNQDKPAQAPRRRISGQSVSFKSSVDQSFVSDPSTMKKDRIHNSPSKQKSMEIRMDGHVVQTMHSDNVKNLNHSYPASGNANKMPPTINSADSTRVSLSRVDSDEGIDDDIKNGSSNHLYSRNQLQDSFAASMQGSAGYLNGNYSFNTTTSASPSTVHPPSSQNNLSVASSEATFQMKPSSYSPNAARGRHQGAMIPEENFAAGASFDESDASNNTGTGLTRRVKDIFNLHTISIFIVKLISYACLCCLKNNNQPRGSSFQDRFILARLNILSFFFSAIQLAASLWLIVVVFVEGVTKGNWDEYQNQFYLWNNNTSVVAIGCLAFVLVFTCLWTTRIVKEVDLVGALRFLWLLLWILPIAAFLNITAFDYHEVTSIWIRHNWNSTQLWWFRNHTCSPDTGESLCMVPIEGGLDYASEDDWCFDIYSSLECSDIRDEAQKKTNFILLTFYRSLASWGCIYMFIMLLIIKSLERIISKPMVQKSREVNVVGWLTFPVCCTALFGSIILFSPYTSLHKLTQPRWVGYLYLIASGLFFIALLMGWILSAFSIQSNLDKQNKSNAALILVVVLFINAFALLTILMVSFMWSNELNLTDGERGDIACTLNDGQCSNCNSGVEALRCPEWSFEEITSIVRRELMQSAVMAAIFILYDLNVMIHGFNLRKHLSMYQIDYV